ncbi:MAG: hypothetical protein WD204_05450 [Acidimicrobiia bacterium]
MMVSDFMAVPLPMDVCQRRITGSDGLALLADASYRRGEELAVGPHSAVAVPVEFSIGVPVVGSNSVEFPVRWRATGATHLFPHMDAELVLSPLGESTHVEFRGVYTPPMGPVGAILDRVALHRLAEATVRNFLERLVELIEVSGASV